MRIRAVLSAALLTAAATACTSSGGAPAKPAPSDPALGTTTTKPLTFGAKPLWTDRTKGVPHSTGQFSVHGESVVMFNAPKGGDSDRLSVQDAATGRTRWSVRWRRPLPGAHGDEWYGTGPYDREPQIVDRGGDWGVLIATTRWTDTRQEPYGLALLDGEDGHVLWRRPLVPAKDKTPHNRWVGPGSVLTDGDRAFLSLRPPYPGKGGELRLAAVDAHSGEPLWTRTGVQPLAVASGSVVAVNVPASAGVGSSVDSGTLTVLDAATGRTRWSMAGRAHVTGLMALAGDLLLVSEQRSRKRDAAAVLDLATGAEVTRMPDQTGGCADDRTRLIACTVPSPEPRLVTIGVGDRKVRVAARTPPPGEITWVRDDRIYYNGVGTFGQEVDRAGTALLSRLPDDLPMAISDEYAVFGSRTSRKYEVYRVV